jgi:hypothetical protein
VRTRATDGSSSSSSSGRSLPASDESSSDPGNTTLEQRAPLVEQFEAERGEEERETFITESGLVEEVEEQDAQV